jgi:hypothetical protein
LTQVRKYLKLPPHSRYWCDVEVGIDTFLTRHHAPPQTPHLSYPPEPPLFSMFTSTHTHYPFTVPRHLHHHFRGVRAQLHVAAEALRPVKLPASASAAALESLNVFFRNPLLTPLSSLPSPCSQEVLATPMTSSYSVQLAFFKHHRNHISQFVLLELCSSGCDRPKTTDTGQKGSWDEWKNISGCAVSLSVRN